MGYSTAKKLCGIVSMLRPRIIPCLLVKDGGLVKTVQFGNPKYVGDDPIGHTANGAHFRLENGERIESDRNAKGTTNREGIIVAKDIHKGIIKRDCKNCVARIKPSFEILAFSVFALEFSTSVIIHVHLC